MRGDRATATNFVQDYAAKRAAQIERARQLREARMQINSQQPAPPQSNLPPSSNNNNSNDASSKAHVDNTSIDAGFATSILPTAVRNSRVVRVVEDDFKRAAKDGIITPDQARQLWAMLSDQLVQVDTTDNSAIANNSSASNSVCPLKGSLGTTMKFGNSISIDSLRASIANFKEQQKLEQGGGKLQGVKANTKTKAQGIKSGGGAVGEVYEIARRVFAAQPIGSVSGTTGTALSRPSYKETPRLDNNDYLGSSTATGEASTNTNSFENRVLQRALTPPRGEGERRRRQPPRMQKRPPFTLDFDLASDNADDSAALVPPVRPSSLYKGQKNENIKVGAQKRVGTNMNTSFDNMPIAAQSLRSEKEDGQQYVKSLSARATGTKRAANIVPQKDSSQRVTSLDDVVVGGGGCGVAEPFIKPQQKEPLKPCEICGRTFVESALLRHTNACAKLQKKRKVFDAKRHRLEGLDGINEVCAPHASARGNKREFQQQQQQQQRQQSAFGAPAGANANKLPKWKIQHEQFQAAMRAIKEMKSDGDGDKGFNKNNRTQLPPPPAPVPEIYDDRVLCPHCGRKFAELTAQRHIPKCMTTVAKPKGIRPVRR